MGKIIFLILSVICFSCAGKPKDLEMIDQIAKDINGVILIARGEQILYEKAFGKYGNPKVSNQFCIASISKQFTAALILNLVDRGLIDIEQPIKQYLPELQDDFAEVVTIKHLLSHTSGIKGLGEPLEFKPGSNFKYSPTLGYYLASLIAEKVTGKSFETLLNDLLRFLHLKDICVLESEDFNEILGMYPSLARGFILKGSGEAEEQTTMGKYNRTNYPGGGVIATARALLGWNLILHTGKLLSENSYKLMITQVAERGDHRYGPVGYGLGLQILSKDGYLELSHCGGAEGYISTSLYYPESKVSVIILENVSLDDGDKKIIFSSHDKIRELIRNSL